MPSPWPIYPIGSFAYWWQRLGALLGACALVYTACAAYFAPPCSPAGELIVLTVLWGVAPPLWWWTEFFFVYPKHHSPEKFELLKHGAQASLAIWLQSLSPLRSTRRMTILRSPKAQRHVRTRSGSHGPAPECLRPHLFKQHPRAYQLHSIGRSRIQRRAETVWG